VPRPEDATVQATVANEAADGDDDLVAADTVGKADGPALHHYVVWSVRSAASVLPRYLRRAGGGRLHCADGTLSATCVIDSDFIAPTAAVSAESAVIFDELEDHPMILEGRLVKVDGRVQLKTTQLRRGLSSNVSEASACYRVSPLSTPEACSVDGDPACFAYRYEQLDSSHVQEAQDLYLDNIDPTPDEFGQATPAVQAKIDTALRLSRTQIVFGCGTFDEPNKGLIAFEGEQLFIP
jgi:hypothetical protein